MLFCFSENLAGADRWTEVRAGAQADRIFAVLYGSWHACHAADREQRVFGHSCRCAPSDRLPAVLLLKACRALHRKKKKLNGSASFLGFSNCVWKTNYARSTFPDFRHLAQTYCVLVPPSTLQRTDLMFDLNILFDLL